MQSFFKNFNRAKFKAILIIGILILSILVLYITSSANKQRTSLFSRASGTSTLKIMTYNILGTITDRDQGKSEEWTIQEMTTLAQYIKDNNIEVVALQEVNNGPQKHFKNIENIQEALANIGYPMFSTRNNQAEYPCCEASSYQAFLHKLPIVPGSYKETGQMDVASDQGGASRYLGASSMIIDTSLGKIRFVNHHPHPDGSRASVAKLIEFVNSLKSENIPMILMGDFNMVFGPPERQDVSKPFIQSIYDTGFYRSCNATKFPSNNCDDTVTEADEAHRYAIDQILIDNRANFVVKNAYVDQNRKESDHLPAITELTNFIPTSTPSLIPTKTPTPSLIPLPTYEINIAGVPPNLWNLVKPAPGNMYPWTNNGPTAGWESYVANYIYICNTKYCWTLNRNTLTWNNNGSPIALDTDPGYITLKATPNGKFLWSDGGPTAAWSWIIPSNGQEANENLICNGNYCWRYLRYASVADSGWRDGGNPIYLPTYNDFWKDSRVAPLWTGNGVTVAWTDPVNSRTTLCNHNDCRSLDYKTWTWRFNGDKIQPYPPGSGVTEYNAAWTSPSTKIISQCIKNNCWQYDIPGAKYSTSATVIISSATPTPTKTPTKIPTKTNTPIPTKIPTKTPVPPTKTPTQVPSSTTRIWNFSFQGQCSNGKILTTAQYPQQWYWFDAPTTQNPSGTTQPLKITGKLTSKYYLLSQIPNGSILPPKIYPVQMSKDTANVNRLTWIGSSLPAGNYTITTTITSPLCNPATATPIPTKTPTKIPTKTNTPIPTKTPVPPTKTPTKIPTSTLTKVPTSTLTKVPTVINTIPPIATSTKVPTQPIFCARKLQGDANCDGIVNLIDIVCWLEQARGKKPANCFSAQNTHGADFNKNGIVGPAKAGVHDGDLLDLGAWRNTYIKENTK